MERTGVVRHEEIPKERIPKHFGNPNHPVCAAAAVASHLFLDVASTPPVSEGELPRLTCIHSL
jgi:hypothetical protein